VRGNGETHPATGNVPPGKREWTRREHKTSEERLESIAELRRICRRENDEDNRKTMLLAARVSIYFTRLFLALNLSANQVTYIFMVLGVLSSLAFLGPGLRWVIAGYILHRLHVICDVSDGEVARYRRTFSAVGAYLDFLTHYFVYSTLLFSISTRYYLDSGRVSALYIGFALAVAVTMNRAATDTWFRANFGKSNRDEIEEGRPGDKKADLPRWRKLAVLGFAHLTSIQTFLNLYLIVSIAERYSNLQMRFHLLAGYAAVLLSFAFARIVVTIRRGKIPRRATYY